MAQPPCVQKPRLLADPRATILALLAARAPAATVCPSEVARALVADWRSAMPAVHAAVDRLVAEGRIRLSWKGQPLATRSGPYRIARPAIEEGLDGSPRQG